MKIIYGLVIAMACAPAWGATWYVDADKANAMGNQPDHIAQSLPHNALPAFAA